MSTRPELEVIVGGASAESRGDVRRSRDLDAEAAVLSNVIYDERALVEVREWLAPEHFCSEAHRRIYEAACGLHDQGEPIDAVTIASALRASGRLDQVGGTPMLSELAAAAPVLAPSHLRAHARRVRDLWVRRQLGVLGQRLTSRTEHDDAGVEVLLVEARARLDELAELAARSEASDRIDAVAERVFAEQSRRFTAIAEGRPGANVTGFAALDRCLAPIEGELALVAGRPGAGKTALAGAIALHAARHVGGVLFASLETGETSLLLRLLCAEARLDVRLALSGALTPNGWSALSAAAADVTKLPLWLDTTPATSVTELWGKARRRQLELRRAGQRLALIVVDYVQLLRAPRPRMTREEVVAENARALKAMASELGCAVLGLAQLNRSVDGRADKRPLLSDLRESGELEQCARLVLMLYREDYYRRRERGYRATGTAEIHVAKQNNGPDGQTVRLGFEAHCARFYELPEPLWPESDGAP